MYIVFDDNGEPVLTRNTILTAELKKLLACNWEVVFISSDERAYTPCEHMNPRCDSILFSDEYAWVPIKHEQTHFGDVIRDGSRKYVPRPW